MKNILLATLSMAFVSLVSCSDHKANMPTDFRAVEYTPIKGASKLGQPFFLRDNQGNPIFVEKSGVAYPMLFDYNGDGKENLLVGDFGMAKNANLLAFDNLGTKKKPLFSSEGNYMVDVNSDKLAIHGHWCLGFYPQVVDLNGDGILDIVSGSYMGNIMLFKGLENGKFDVGTEVEQTLDRRERDYFSTVMFTNPYFDDFNNDGLLDAFVGGVMGVRVILNEGTKSNPIYGERINLLRTDGEKVSIHSVQADKDYIVEDYKTFVNYVDWDRDGVKDLITTMSYYQYGGEPILFHKGVNTDDGVRFEQGIPLIKEDGGKKVLPGSGLIPYVCDYNHDGKLDILLGVTFNYSVSDAKIDLDGAYDFYMDKEFIDIYNKYIELSKKTRENPDDELLKSEYSGVMDRYREISASKRNSDENIRARGYILVFQGI